MPSIEEKIDCVEKLHGCETLTVTVKGKSDNTTKVITGLTVAEILNKLAINQEYESVTKKYNLENLNENKSLASNTPSPENVGFVNASSSESNEGDCETSKIRPARGFNTLGKYSDVSKIFNVLKRSFDLKRPDSAFKRPRIMTGSNKDKKTVFKNRRRTDINILKGFVDKQEYEFDISTKENEICNIDEQLESGADNSESKICVIEEVIGNAVDSFSKNSDSTFYDYDDVICLDPKESQLIVPKKTDDITKIKGWRRKQFFVERPTTIEFQQISFNSEVPKKIFFEPNLSESEPMLPNGHVENAFVCESLDEFLEQEAELKVEYEIPHLFAEVGIKLTKEELASAPSLSEEDIKEVETKYCCPIPSQNDIINLDDIKTEEPEEGKRHIEDDCEEYFKKVKLENNNVRLVRSVKISTDKQRNRLNKYPLKVKEEMKEKNVNEIKLDNKNLNQRVNLDTVKLTSKVLGLIVYPCPYKPLHPIVQYHLKKLRSYNTTVDSNWANFAASVVVSKDSKYKRFVLPATCCVKQLKDSEDSIEEITCCTPSVSPVDAANDVISLVEENETIIESKEDQGLICDNTFSAEELKRMKSCKVVIKKLEIGTGGMVFWCTKHNRINCENCTFVQKPENEFRRKSTKENKIIKSQGGCERSVLKSSQKNFYRNLASLLTVRLKMFDPNSLTSIDSLKTLSTNAVELIKLRFVQKSFLHNYVSVWYLKQQKAGLRSRAFLTFSKTPPVPNAVNLRYGLVARSLPKVVREIVHCEKSVDPNEYVLLYCNGKYWEIHGSVNVAFNKPKSAEQVVIPTDLPELSSLRNISAKTLKVKAFKWWVLDLTQRFQSVEIKLENIVVKVSHKKFFDFVKTYDIGFMLMKTNSVDRIFGAFVTKKLLPYVLIGPYNLFEIHNLSLRGSFSPVPFTYNEVKDSNESSSLKFHISSTIKKARETGKIVEGLWLHYKASEGQLCFLEVKTVNDVSTTPRSNYSVHDDHGYSLSSSFGLEQSHNSVESQNGNSQVEVYLYFDIVGLGYVLGVLEEDNSVTISHPFNEQAKVNSPDIGNWFLGVIRRKMQFIPSNLPVNWFVTKHKSHLRNRQPFNKNILDGSHVLTDSGIFYILKFKKSNCPKCIFKKDKSFEAVPDSFVVEELFYLKVLSDILVEKSNKKPDLENVLTMALQEIRKLKKKSDTLERVKACLEEEKFRLFNSYLITIHLKGLNIKLSVMLLKKIEKLFFNAAGELRGDYEKKLNLYNFGRQYLKTIERQNVRHRYKRNS